MPSTSLAAWGWLPERDATPLPANCAPARIIAEHRNRYELFTADGAMPATLAGRLRHAAEDKTSLPAVGDWVAVVAGGDAAVIHAVLPRYSSFVRQAAGGDARTQVVAANIDSVWLVNALDQPLNPRRIERYLALAWESGATPLVVLTKTDLCADIGDAQLLAEETAIGVPVHAICALDGTGMDALAATLRAGHTVALLGVSGAGKSTLVNALAGKELLRTAPVRDDDHRGRHTTTHRQLLRLDNGALILDTPGMRELGLVDSGAGIHDTFADIDTLAAGCRFTNCVHEREPDCAVLAAVGNGTLLAERLASFRKLQREDAWHARRHDARAQAEETRKWKHLHKALRDHDKRR